jgi:hypothetical protein
VVYNYAPAKEGSCSLKIDFDTGDGANGVYWSCSLGDIDLTLIDSFSFYAKRSSSSASNVGIEMSDTSGNRAKVGLSGLGTIWGLHSVNLSALKAANPSLDLQHISAVTFVYWDGAAAVSGTLYLDKLSLNGSVSWKQGSTMEMDTKIGLNMFKPSRGESSTIFFKVNRLDPLTIRIYNIAGNLVATIQDGQRAGQLDQWISKPWNGTDNAGNIVGPGIYLVSFESGSFRKIEKIIVK